MCAINYSNKAHERNNQGSQSRKKITQNEEKEDEKPQKESNYLFKCGAFRRVELSRVELDFLSDQKLDHGPEISRKLNVNVFQTFSRCAAVVLGYGELSTQKTRISTHNITS